MRNSSRILRCVTFSLAISLTVVLLPADMDSLKYDVNPAEQFPRWLMNDSYHPSQTSGITFLRQNADGSSEFLLADDVGKIHRLFIENDTLFRFSEIKFSDSVNEFLASFPKPDFEEIFYDHNTGEVFVSIEGNDEEHLLYHGIYKLKFFCDDIFRDSIIHFEKLDFKPGEVFINNLSANIGYEGFTADENYYYLGMENIQMSERQFSEKTVIRIAEKKSLTIVKEIFTDTLGIGTVCGLYSEENFSLWGIDRNQKRFFKMKFDDYFNIVDLDLYQVSVAVPDYNRFEYVGSLESITLASKKYLYLVDDPWHAYFIPPDEILEKLDSTTINNFKNFIPVIYKLVIE